MFFKRYEPEHIATVTVLLVAVPGTLVPLVRSYYSTLLGAVFTTYIAYWSFIISFVVAYRLSPFHPLAKYPGPALCRLSKGWFAYVVATNGRSHLYVYDMHKKYHSDVVRTGVPALRTEAFVVNFLCLDLGPNELSITHEAVASDVLGPKGLSRGPCMCLFIQP